MPATHTPGPFDWEWMPHPIHNDGHPETVDGEIVQNDGRPDGEGRGATVAYVVSSEADARLWCAAPDLLAALERTVAWIQTLHPDKVTEWNLNSHGPIVRAAISKARRGA